MSIFLQNFQKNDPKWPKNGRILKSFVSSFFHPKEPLETGTSHFHYGSIDNFPYLILSQNSNFGPKQAKITKKWKKMKNMNKMKNYEKI